MGHESHYMLPRSNLAFVSEQRSRETDARFNGFGDLPDYLDGAMHFLQMSFRNARHGNRYTPAPSS